MGQHPRPEPLIAHQRHFLTRVLASGLIKDEALASALRDLGVPCDRSTLTKYRTGDRSAPLGLLWVMLAHLDAEEQLRLLNLVGADFGLRVVHDAAHVDTSRSLTDETLDVVAASGKLVATVQAALADGIVTDDDRAQIREALDHAKQQIAEAESALDNVWTEKPGPRAVR